MKKPSHLLLSLLFLFSLILPSVAYAAIPYEASNVLGQTDTNGAITYTKGYIFNGLRERKFSPRMNLAIDEVNHRLFVGDQEGNRILVYNLDASNEPIDYIPDNVLGQPDFSTYTQRSTSASTVNFSGGLLFDSTNNRLFVSNENRISIFDVSSITNNEDAVNVLGQTDFTSNTGGTTQSTMNGGGGVFNGVLGMALDPATNYLFVADAKNDRVMIFDVTSITNGENAVNVLGQADFVSSGSAATQSRMYGPQGVAVDPTGDRLFVVEAGNARVLVFDISTITNGEAAINVLGQTNFTNTGNAVTQGRLWGPRGVAFDDAGDRLFVGDESNHRVMIFDVAAITDGENAVNVLGQSVYTSQTYSSATASSVQNPSSVVFNATNNRLYVPEFTFNGSTWGRVSIFDTASISNNEAAVDIIGPVDGNGDPYFTANRYGPSSNGFYQPSSIAIDSVNHRMFVAELGANRVTVFNLDTNNNLVDRTADYVLGQSNFVSEGSATTQNGMSGPGYLAFDDENNRLFVSDSSNSRVLVFDTNTIVNGENAVNVLGQTDFVSSVFDITQNNFDYPAGLAYDEDGERLFVVDNSNSRVMVFDVASITNGENAINVLGSTDFISSDFGNTTQNTLNYPLGASFDTTNNRLFVADESNDRIMVFDVASITNGENAVNVLGQTDFVTSGSSLSQNGMRQPQAMVYDEATSMLHVADTRQYRILTFDVASITDGENAVSVIGASNFTNSGSGLSQTDFFRVWGIAHDPLNNRLYIADAGTSEANLLQETSANNRVLAFDLVNLPETANFANGTTTEAYSQTLTTGSQGTVTHSLDSGTLPPGLSISGNTLSGTPTSAGTYNFTLTSTDTVSSGVIVFKDTQAYSVTIASGSGGGGGGGGSSGGSGSSSSGTTNGGNSALTQISNVLNIIGQQINVSKTSAKPTITLVGASTMNLGNGRPFIDPGATAQYAQDGNLTNKIVTTGTVNSSTPGSYKITYTVTDSSKKTASVSRTVRVQKNTKPTLTLIGSSTITLALGAPFVDPGIKSSDVEDGDLTNKIVTTGTVNSSTPGTYKITYTVTDSAGLTHTISRTVRVQKNARPTIKLIGSSTVSTLIGTSFIDPGATAYDTEDGDLTNKIVITGKLSTSTLGKYQLTYTVTDSLKLSASVRRTVLVVKELPTSTPPVVLPPVISEGTSTGAGTLSILESAGRRVRGAFRQISYPISDFLTHTFSQVLNVEEIATLEKIVRQIATILTTISLVGIVAGGFASPLVHLSADRSFYSTLNIRRSWLSFLSITGLRKRAEPWGTVYDSETKQPIDPAIVVLKDLSGKEVSSAITDLDGRFGFLVPPGEYTMEVSKTNYVFPSHKLEGKDSDVLYHNLYFGGPISVTLDKAIINYDVPMDRKVFDWNQFQKLERKDMRFFSRHEVLIARFNDFLFFTGFFISLATLFVTLTTLTVSIFIIQIVILVCRLLGKPQKYGSIRERRNGAPLQFALVRAINADVNQEIRHTVTDEHGRYYCLVAPGNYSLQIEERVANDTYQKVQSVGPFSSKTGLIDKHLKIAR